MLSRRTIVAILAAAALALPLPALAGIYGPPSPPGGGEGGGGGGTAVDANGNPFSGGLGFDPERVRVAVGALVRWTNTDTVVPHTVTEDHGIFDLGGTYGSPGNMGFGPGESVSRRFAAGTFGYYCKIHPQQMRGVVATTMAVSLVRGRVAARGTRIRAVWARASLPSGQVFDVQRRLGRGPWRTVRGGTRATAASIAAATGQVAFRARIRVTSDGGGASGYSPPARIRIG